MVNVLFVDDDVAALDAMRRSLRSRRAEWNVTFHSDSTTAVELAERLAPDVVVSDLRMPHVDGIALLTALVKRGNPAIRIVLSAEVSERAFIDSLGVANQFLLKPVDPNALADAIQRAGELRSWLALPEVARALEGRTVVATLPAVYRDLVEAVRREASLAELGAILEQDPAMTARILQVVNSAYFAPRRPITSVSLAASFLGLEMLRPLVLSIAMHATIDTDPALRQRFDHIWKESVAVASLARTLALDEAQPRDAVASTFSLGILHDIGAIPLVGEHEPIDVGLDGGDDAGGADVQERGRYGVSHCDVGARLLRSWALPDDAVAVAAWHHDAARLAGPTARSPGFYVAAAVALLGEGAAQAPTVELARLRNVLALRGETARLERWMRLSGRETASAR